MINENNLIDVLKNLKFSSVSDNIYKKFFNKVNCSIEVDIANRRIIYPEEIQITARTTTNFESPENFVVLECVTRLLDKGYRPKHIELEKTWTLGHTQKGGRSDIFVSGTYDEEGGTDKNLTFIIECKTAGVEYEKERNNMLNDGGQLFSYWHQERSCQWLILYTSDFVDGKIKYTADSVDCRDDSSNRKHLYKDAHNVKELFNVWATTYEKKFCGDVIFNADTVAYQIGQKPLTKSRLVEFDYDNKIVNKFEETLRHNNISDKENAFNRLMALFICKLTDEKQKLESDEMEFQYKKGTDTFESFQDRLQRLYHEGMKTFMNEDIFYVPINFIEDRIKYYTGHNRNNLIADLNDQLRKLKFYTNNDFSFKEVHNDKLFEQNAKILIEVVEIFQNYKIIGAKNLQFLGDLFEQLLNKGFKQNEGQFFTPLPITRFIWDSLPLDKLIKSADELPKIIDYACGAGHFLTQGFESVNNFVDKNFNVKLGSNWVSDKLFGIEKDYRLARVSKISLFMHGAGSGKIIFGDGLENNHNEVTIKTNSFDILVANPPYSVSAFKRHLRLENAKDYTVLDSISMDGSEIETLFVERIAQLLKPCGIAAVILPSSILNKENTSFIAARESILKNFHIRAIVQLGSKTFGATGTNTVVMFLEKFNEPPKRIEAVEDSLDAIFELRNLSNWEDEAIFNDWLIKINVDKATYKTFLSCRNNFGEWATNDYFGQYYKVFVNSREYIKKTAQPSFKKLSNDEQLQWFNQRFYDFAFTTERDKLRYFAYVYKQTTLIVTAPDDNKLQEKFLGYTWSNRKGQEGMQLVNEGGLLYDKDSHDAENTIAALIRHMFNDQQLVVDSLSDHYYYLRLQDMIDFNNMTFNKVIRISNIIKENANIISTNYLNDTIGNLCILNPAKSEIANIPDDTIISFIEMASLSNDGRIINLEDRTLSEVKKGSYKYFAENDIIIAKITPCMENGKCAIAKSLTNKIGFGSSEFHVVRCKEAILPEYLFCLLNREQVRKIAVKHMTGASGHRRVPIEFYENMTIPVPPLDVQENIINEFNDIENKIQAEDDFLLTADENIKSKFDEMFGDKLFNTSKLEDIVETLNGLWIGKKPPFKKVKVIRNTNFTMNGTLNLKDVAIIEVEENKFTSRRLKYGDIIIEKSGGSETQAVGRVVLFNLNDEDYSFSNFTNRLRIIDSDVNPIYLHTVLNNIYNSGTTFNYQYGMSGLKNLDLKSYLKMSIKIPPIEEQQKFADYVQSVESQKAEAVTRKEHLITQRNAIIDKYFR